jgi:hypothetical protein
MGRPTSLSFDFAHPEFDSVAVRAINPQRGAMAQLSAVASFNREDRLAVGWNDFSWSSLDGASAGGTSSPIPFWVICETAAQLAGFVNRATPLFPPCRIGLGGFDTLRLVGQRATVEQSARLIAEVRLVTLRRRRATFEAAVWCEEEVLLSGIIHLVPLDRNEK